VEHLTPDLVFKDPYLLDFLGLNDRRKLRRLVAVDLKLGRFKADHKGQMELYLLLRLHEGNIRVAAYMTDLPPKKLLQTKQREAMQIARHRLESVEGA